jgi:hypothetical protein
MEDEQTLICVKWIVMNLGPETQPHFCIIRRKQKSKRIILQHYKWIIVILVLKCVWCCHNNHWMYQKTTKTYLNMSFVSQFGLQMCLLLVSFLFSNVSVFHESIWSIKLLTKDTNVFKILIHSKVVVSRHTIWDWNDFYSLQIY